MFRKQAIKPLSFFIFLALFLLRCSESGAQQGIRFTHLTNQDGLSQSTVQAILKDRYGFMWFGTQDGLNRYDGNEFKVYRHHPKDSGSLRKSHIMCLYEDRQGSLWVGTNNGGLSLLDRKTNSFKHYREMEGDRGGLSQRTVTSMYEDSEGNFWIGTYWKLNLLNRKTGEVTQFAHDPSNTQSISNDAILCMMEDRYKQLWIGTTNGLNILDRKTGTFKRFFHTADSNSLSDNNIRTIYEDSLGRLWIGTVRGLNLYDHATGTFKRYLQDPSMSGGPGDNEINAITYAGGGKMWIGTKSTLDLFDPAKNLFTYHKSDANQPTGLNKNANITSLYRKDGILWVGTYQGGINKYDEQLSFFDIRKNNPNDWESLSFNVVSSFAEAKDGKIWIGTGGGALNLWDRQTNKFLRYNPDPTTNSLSTWGVLSLHQGRSKRYLWIGTYGGAVDRFDQETKTFMNIPHGQDPQQLNNEAVYAILEDQRGQLWFGTNGGGVNVLDPNSGEIKKYIHNPDDKNTVGGNYIRCFLEDRKGNIWIGSTGGVSVYHPATKSFIHYNQNNSVLESDMIFSFLEDSKGNIWIGTLGGGLNKLDARTGKITIYTTFDGLPDNTINSIVEDGKGYLWISTNNGLSRFDPSNNSFRNHGFDNGIQSYEFSQGAAIKTSSGDLLFGGVNGFNIIQPDLLIENKNIPPVVITSFRLMNREVIPGDDSPLKNDILETKSITLSHNQSFFTFEFAALGFTSPGKNSYAYMLEGFDKDWIHSGTSHRATYTNLAPGRYVFRVKAANNDGLWNEKVTSIEIIIQPPYWQTWWFRLLVMILITALILFIYQSRVRVMRKQKKLLEQQVLERTQSLAMMTREERKARQEADEANKELEHKNKELEQFAYVASHDLQEPLRTISSFVQLLQVQYKGKLDERSDKYLSYITQASDRMKVLINDLLEYSRLGRKKEKGTVNCQVLVNELRVDLDKMITENNAVINTGLLPILRAYPSELKQVFQNLIVNAIKFSKKDQSPEIEIKAVRKDHLWEFSVQDNGIGIDPQHSERIFIIFQRLHTRNEYEGSGIGLSNCRKIIELHKGRIWVESKPGEGSRFCFTIPDSKES